MWAWIKLIISTLFGALRISNWHKREQELAEREAYQKEKEKVNDFEDSVREEIEAVHAPGVADDDPMGVNAWNRGD